jgi:solute carrier family 25 folate transporter 32
LGKDSPLRGKAFPHFISGLFGSFLSVTVCHPLEIARVRLNLQNATPSPNKYKGLLHALATVFKEEGYFGFYKGTLNDYSF